mmetsp:Transcript_69164/g.223552  ORF Transcript_69164/g.223552 Transcript_69164/m.223552 type:complete len:266 (+) Transcript_69164:105-902(+)
MSWISNALRAGCRIIHSVRIQWTTHWRATLVIWARKQHLLPPAPWRAPAHQHLSPPHHMSSAQPTRLWLALGCGCLAVSSRDVFSPPRTPGVQSTHGYGGPGPSSGQTVLSYGRCTQEPFRVHLREGVQPAKANAHQASGMLPLPNHSSPLSRLRNSKSSSAGLVPLAVAGCCSQAPPSHHCCCGHDSCHWPYSPQLPHGVHSPHQSSPCQPPPPVSQFGAAGRSHSSAASASVPSEAITWLASPLEGSFTFANCSPALAANVME